MNKKIIWSMPVVLLMLTTACSPLVDTQVEEESSIQIEEETTVTDRGEDRSIDKDRIIISQQEHENVVEFTDKMTVITELLDQNLFAVQDIWEALSNRELGENEFIIKFRQSEKKFKNVNDELSKIQPPVLESEILTKQFEDFYNDMLLTNATGQDAISGILEAWDMNNKDKLPQAEESWKRAWAYYDDVDQSMDDLYESIKKVEIQAE